MIAVLARELVQRFRGGGVYWLLFLNGLVLAAVAVATERAVGTYSPWVAPAIGSTSPPVPSTLGGLALAWRGQALFAIMTLWQLFLVTAIVPGIAASALAAERRDGTLPLLFASGASGGAVVLAKFLAALLHGGVILLSSAPAAVLVWLLGGVPPLPLGVTLALLASHTALVAAIGTLASAISRHGAAATIATYVAAVATLVAPLVLATAASLAGWARTARFVASLSPLTIPFLSQSEYATTFLRAAPLPSGLRFLRFDEALVGPPFNFSLWSVVFLADLLLITLLLLIAAVAIDPLHPIKTVRLRRAAALRADA